MAGKPRPSLAAVADDHLLAEHGPGMRIPALLRIIAADCPRMIEGRTHDVCGVHSPDLSRRALA
jgi:hypothetical protein